MSGIYNFYTKAKKKLTDTVGGLGAVAKQFKSSLDGAGSNITKTSRSVMDFGQSAPRKIESYVTPSVKMASDFFKENPTPQSYLQKSVIPKVEKKVKNYFAPTSEVRARDIVREIPKAVRTTYNATKSGDLGKTISDELGKTDYFKPTEKMRVRDVVREIPLGVDKSLQGAAQDVARFAISTAEIPKTLATGQASKKYYKIPLLGKVNSFQSEAQNRVERGDSLWKAIGNPALDTVLAGSDVGAVAKPLLSAAKNVAKFGKAGKEVANIADDLTKPLGKTMKQVIPARTEPVSPNIYDAQPEQGTFKIVKDKLKKVDGFQMTRDTKPFNMPEQTIDVPFEFKSNLMQSVQRPGLTIKDVSKGKGFDEKIAIKNKSAQELVNNQIENQKVGLPKAEPGFVAPENLPAPQNKSKAVVSIEEYVNGPKEAPSAPVAPKQSKQPVPSIEEFVNKKTGEITSAKPADVLPIDKELAKIKPEWHTDYKMIKDDIDKTVKDEAEYMMSLKNEMGEVGTYKKLGEGEIGGDTGLRRFSSNPQWYRDFFEEHGRAPAKWEVAKIAEDNLKNGNGINAEKYNNLRGTLVDLQQESAKVIESPANPFNQFQQRAFDKKKERIDAITTLMNYPAELRKIGYKKGEVDRIGKDQAERILKLSKLGYPKLEIQKMDFDRMDLILDRNVPWQTLKSYYERKHALDTKFLDGIDPATLKDINPLMTGGRDVYRNFETVFGKNYPKIKAQLLDPFDQAKGNMMKEQEFLTNEIFENVVKKFGIEKGSKIDKAVVEFGEGKIKLEALQEKFPKDWQKIVEADNWFKNKYPQLLEDLNAVREANFPTHPLYPESTKIIPFRKDYYRHGQETDGLAGLKNLFEGPSSIDPALAATSDVTNPKTKWLSFGQQRKSDANDFGAVEGYLDYIKNHSYAKHIDPFIQKFKGVDDEAKDALPNGIPKAIGLAEELSNKLDPVKQITESTDPSKIKQILMSKGVSDMQSEWMSKNLSEISSEEKVRVFLKSKLAKNKNTNINKFEPSAPGEKGENQENNFLVFIKNFSRDLAGKTNPIDRGLQENFFGRKALNIVNWTNSRFKANAVLGNLSSSIAQIFNVPQGFASAGARNSAKGFGHSLAGIFKQDGPIKQSSFINERYFKSYNKFDTGVLDNTKKFAVWITGVGDEIGTKFIWNAHYQKALSEGIPNPVKYADDWARKMVAGRGIGEVPIAQKSKIVQVIAPFQLEVANQWYALRDIAKNDPRKLVMAKKLIEFSVASFLMNRLAKEIRGSDVSFDPLNAMLDAYNEYSEEDNKLNGLAKAGGRVGGEVVSNLPLGSTVASTILSESNRKKYMGDADPSRFGTGAGLLLGSGLISGDILTKEGWKKTGGDLASKLALPYGGKQVQKTIQGANALINGFTENTAGNVMTPVERKPSNIARGLMFGKNAFGEMQDYFDNDQTPLSPQQTEKYKLMGNDANFFTRISNERKADNERAELKIKSDPVKAMNLSDNIARLSNGNFYAKSLNREFTTEKEAKKEIAKQDFMDSNDRTREVDGQFWYKDAVGDFKSMTIAARKKNLEGSSSNLEMDRAKGRGDMNAWIAAADRKIASLDAYLATLDPAIDQDEIDSVTLAKENLYDTAQKYAEQGGFKKGKKTEEKYRYSLVDPEMLKIKRLLAGTTGRKPTIGKRPLRLIQRRLPTVRRTSKR